MHWDIYIEEEHASSSLLHVWINFRYLPKNKLLLQIGERTPSKKCISTNFGYPKLQTKCKSYSTSPDKWRVCVFFDVCQNNACFSGLALDEMNSIQKIYCLVKLLIVGSFSCVLCWQSCNKMHIRDKFGTSLMNMFYKEFAR